MYVPSLAFRSLYQLLSWPLMATTLYSSKTSPSPSIPSSGDTSSQGGHFVILRYLVLLVELFLKKKKKIYIYIYIKFIFN